MTTRTVLRLLISAALPALAVMAASEAVPSSSPSDDPADIAVWPNQTSRANSDSWLVENHDRIRRMNPRVLLVNFSNGSTREHLDKMTRDLFTAIAEGSRYHGYTNPAAPAFLNYSVFRFVDLAERGSTNANSSKVPFKPGVTNTFNVDYDRFFSEEFARHYGVKDPKESSRFLRLDELVAGGFVHEMWFFADHDEHLKAYESVEEKPVYDEQFRRHPTKWVQAGNGGDDDQRWTGRSVRLGFINVTRGIGCFMESLSHSFEGTANSKAIPYFTRYFHEFAGHDMNTRYNLPWQSFYPLWGSDAGIEYPDEKTAVVKFKGRTWRLDDYLAYGGNAHFPPNGRRHYDLDNTKPVLSTIEDWRIGSGPEGKDIAKPWTNEAFARYRRMAPDCMGPWLIYWRQNIPGLDNKQRDDAGKLMKNWWPFLFY